MALRDIPGVDGDEVTGYEALNVVTLPLTQPSRKRKLSSLALLTLLFSEKKKIQEF